MGAAKSLFDLVLKAGTPAAGVAAATQSEDADASLVGILSRGANTKGAQAAIDLFADQVDKNPNSLMSRDGVIANAIEQSEAARAAGNQSQGWFIGADLKPRYEINDSNASINREWTKDSVAKLNRDMPENTHFRMPLRDYLNHNPIYNAYPHLENIPLMLNRGDSPLMGGGSSDAVYIPPIETLPRGAIGMNIDSILETDRHESLQTLMHEVQHAIQNKEGFARGTSVGEAPQDVADWIKSDGQSGAQGLGYGRLPESFQTNKKENLSRLLDYIEDPDDEMADFHQHLAYYMSAGESESRAVENRLRMLARDRRDRHPLEDYAVPDYMLPPGNKGPNIFQMIEAFEK